MQGRLLVASVAFILGLGCPAVGAAPADLRAVAERAVEHFLHHDLVIRTDNEGISIASRCREQQVPVFNAAGKQAGVRMEYEPGPTGFFVHVEVRHVNEEFLNFTRVENRGDGLVIYVNRPVSGVTNPVYLVYARFGSGYDRAAAEEVIGRLLPKGQ